MPMYDYKCADCEAVTTVVRKITEHELPPDDGCEACKSKNLKRVILGWNKHQFIKPWGGVSPWHDEAYSATRRIRDK